MTTKKIWLVTLLIVLMVMIAGCAVTKGNSPPAVSNDNQEQVGSDMGEVVDAEEDAPEKSRDQEKVDNQTATQTADQNQAAAPCSEKVQPLGVDNKVGTVKLLVTRNFGSQILFQETVKVEENWTIMDLLKAKMKVETRYGGGFIDSINGLKSSSAGLSGEMQDWFYYVNGICPDVGGLDYKINPGEVIWWDYHVWKAGFANAAVIGCYPEPFLHGYNGQMKTTIIMCLTDDLERGKRLEQSLKARGVKSVKVIQIDEGLLSKRQEPTIVLGEWEKLKQIPFMQDFNQAYKRNGTGVHFNEKKLELIDIQGQVVQTREKAGVITAAGSGLGDTCPLWIVSGTDNEGFEGALNILLNNPGKIAGKYNAVITAGEVISLPWN